MPLLISFVIGSALGSFLNVVIDRLSTGRSIAKGRSYCEHCKKTLQPQDLIPVISYLLLGGKCRYCKHKIPLRIFIVEILCGSAFVFLAMQVLIGAISLIPAILLSILILCFIGIFFADIEYGIIPDMLVVVSLVASLLYLFATNAQITNHLLSGVFVFAFFFLLFAITRGKGMGFGDVKFSFVMGLLLGSPLVIVALYIAFLTGAGVSIILVIWKKLRFFGTTIPFGPFLVASTFVALFYGDLILQMFMARFMP